MITQVFFTDVPDAFADLTASISFDPDPTPPDQRGTRFSEFGIMQLTSEVRSLVESYSSLDLMRSEQSHENMTSGVLIFVQAIIVKGNIRVVVAAAGLHSARTISKITLSPPTEMDYLRQIFGFQ